MVSGDGVSLDLLSGHNSSFKRALCELTRQAILLRLRDRIAGHGGGRARKDMAGVPYRINTIATLRASKSRKSPSREWSRACTNKSSDGQHKGG